MINIKFLQENFDIKILFCNHIISVRWTLYLTRKGKDPEPDPRTDPYLWVVTNRSGKSKNIRILRIRNTVKNV